MLDLRSNSKEIAPARDALLFTPGPLTTSMTVKQAMLRDRGSWHDEFTGLVADIRRRLLSAAGLSREDGWEVIPIQGSGTFAVEAVFQSCVPRVGKVLVLTNGAYGDRMIQMLQQAGISHSALRFPENEPVCADELKTKLDQDTAVTHVAMVHCETTTGILNPIKAIGEIAKARRKVFMVDAMSSFGGVPIDFDKCKIDFLVSSANKCLEGVPGVAFVFCRRAVLLGCANFSRSLSLDLFAQLQAFDKNEKFRFTPPTHVLAALHQALVELEVEGGISARHLRYVQNHRALQGGMRRFGFQACIAPDFQSPVITAYYFLAEYEFDFSEFYNRLAARGFILYPGKLTQAKTFRIGNIGRIFEADILALLAAIREVLVELGVNPVPITESIHADFN
jgi:2-aminoethylphosphonate-pyruvate transaminase